VRRRSGWSEGWRLAGLISAACAAVLLAGWVLGPGGEPGVRALIRTSARLSLTLFLLAFSASALRRLWPVAASAWLLRNRRPVGVAFAVAHGLHLALIVTLARLWPSPFFANEGRASALVGGGLAYLLILSMALTSSDRAVAALGARRWKRLHSFGVHYVWAIFTLANARRVPQGAEYALFSLALLLALGLRLLVAARARRGVAPIASDLPA
jgi:DMSO/TMAO reductase YedYZ heme-binding membrane subunit